MSVFISENIKLILSLVAIIYLTAGGIACKRRFQSLGGLIFAIGALLNLIVVLANWIISGHPPMGTMYHVMTLLPLCFYPAWLILGRKMPWALPFFAIVAALPLGRPIFGEAQLIWNRPAALKSSWFIPHVMAYMFSYSLAAVAFAITVFSGIKKLINKEYDNHKLRKAAINVATFAFPFMTFAMLAGAIWANDIWGRFWGWDVKECWALITWLLYLLTIYTGSTSRTRSVSEIFQSLAFIALIITLLIIQLMPNAQSLHLYSSS